MYIAEITSSNGKMCKYYDTGLNMDTHKSGYTAFKPKSVFGNIIRIGIVPNNAKIIPFELFGYVMGSRGFNANKIILSDMYHIKNVKTFVKLKFIMNYQEFIHLCYMGSTKILDDFRNLNLISIDEHLYYYKNDPIFFMNTSPTSNATGLTSASRHGHANILEWLKEWVHSYGLQLEYSDRELDLASENGHINVLNWWFNSGYPLKYNHAINWATQNGHINVLEWWKNSRLSIIYSNNVLIRWNNDFSNIDKRIDVLNWWKNSNLPLNVHNYNINYAMCRKNIRILEWFINNGFPVSISCQLYYLLYRKIYRNYIKN